MASRLSFSAKIYVGLVVLAGLALLVLVPGQLPDHLGWYFIAVLLGTAAAAAVTQIVDVQGPTTGTGYDPGLVVFGFSLVVLGQAATVMVVVFAGLLGWLWHRYAWFVQGFNIGALIIGVTASGAVYQGILDSASTSSLRGAAAAFAASLTFVALNHLMVGLAAALVRGENFGQSGVFDRVSVRLDGALVVLGTAAGVLWQTSPYICPLLILPLYVLSLTLRVPALERQATTDSKTGLYNARCFQEALDRELARASRLGRPLTLVIGDLDLLRNINNTYGHLAGDNVLMGVAAILKDSFRSYDVVARFGGEEFTILMPETTVDNARPRIEHVRQVIEESYFDLPASKERIKATMSFGMVECGEGGHDGKEMLHLADLALYRAKLDGRNRVQVASEDEAIGGAAAHPHLTDLDAETVGPPPRGKKGQPPQAEIRAASRRLPASET